MAMATQLVTTCWQNQFYTSMNVSVAPNISGYSLAISLALELTTDLGIIVGTRLGSSGMVGAIRT